MLIPNHPDEERLAALAGGDPDATGDRTLQGHVTECLHCGAILADLTTLRAAMAELPDLAPHRPLELRLPESKPGVRERLAVFSRRAFAPAMGVATALLLVGVVGTGTDLAGGIAMGPAAAPEADQAPAGEAPADEAPAVAPLDAGEDSDRYVDDGAGVDEDRMRSPVGDAEDQEYRATPEVGTAAADGDGEEPGRFSYGAATEAAVQAWPWTGLLAAGIVLMVLSLTLRAVVRPRR
jgi:hypothetical protein